MGLRFLASVNGVIAIAAVSLAPVLTACQTSSGAAEEWTPPRTPWGDPDLQGIYTNKADNNTPLERPKEFGTRQFLTDEEYAKRYEYTAKTTTGTADDPNERGTNATRDKLRGPTDWHEKGVPSRRTSLIVDPPDGRFPPYTPEGEKRAKAVPTGEADLTSGRAGSWLDRSLYERCITRSLPDSMLPGFYGHYYQIRQIPGYVSIQYEMVHEVRTIPLDGRPHLDSSIRPYMGDSRGHWEGNTLVVDVTNFPHNINFRGAGGNLHLIERFTPVGPDTINWEVTIDDPTTWTRPWKLTTDLLAKDDAAIGGQGPSERRIFQYECHEGNYGMINLLSSTRLLERQAAKGVAKK